MFRRASDDVGWVWTLLSITLWVQNHWGSLLAFLGMSGLGVWIAQAIEPVSRHGWGLVVFTGLFVATLLALVWALVCHGYAQLRAARPGTARQDDPPLPAHAKIEIAVTNEAREVRLASRASKREPA
jgi:hypothetical protein